MPFPQNTHEYMLDKSCVEFMMLNKYDELSIYADSFWDGNGRETKYHEANLWPEGEEQCCACVLS
jgi:hypothetical protein